MTIPRPSAGAARSIERARQLIAAGVPELALSEIEDEISRKGGTERALWYAQARIYCGNVNFLDAILSLRRAFPDYNYLPPSSLPDEIWNLLFPVRHLNVVSRYAARNRLDPNLILGLIRQESAFNETARSGANARGLMQLLPDTGRMLARQEGITPYSASRLYQPEVNIALGTRYLADRIKKYGGRTELALAAYNAGDIRVDRWLREFGDVDMAEFVELIPFSETRGYVKQVLSNVAHYHVRTAPAAAGPKSDQRKQ
jgi:soluble lytic murein transglycosylase